MPTAKNNETIQVQLLGPLPENLQMGARVYQVLLYSIVTGQIESGAPLRPDIIARQLEVSTTPVREAMQRLETDGLASRLPNRGWFVREFTNRQIQELYEFRVSLELFGVQLACERITDAELVWLQSNQLVGQAALAAGDKDAYRIYNQEFHAAIMKAARNSYLSNVMGQLRLQSEMLSAKTILIEGRPSRAFEEHGRLIDLIARRDAPGAGQLIRSHILSALEDYIRSDMARR